MMLPGKGSRRICGLVGLDGPAGLKFGFACELKGLKIATPLSLKSPRASAGVGTVPTIVCAMVCRKPS